MQITNYDEFVKLAEFYEELSNDDERLGQMISQYRGGVNWYLRTNAGFGRIDTCSLCQSTIRSTVIHTTTQNGQLDYEDIAMVFRNPVVNCERCMWSLDEQKNRAFNYCVDASWKALDDEIETISKAKHILQSRVTKMKTLIKLYNEEYGYGRQ